LKSFYDWQTIPLNLVFHSAGASAFLACHLFALPCLLSGTEAFSHQSQTSAAGSNHMTADSVLPVGKLEKTTTNQFNNAINCIVSRSTKQIYCTNM
jgi:hypothetical protein